MPMEHQGLPAAMKQGVPKNQSCLPQLRAAAPRAHLISLLQGHYSEALYGRRGAVPQDAGVVWLDLAPPPAIEHLRAVGLCSTNPRPPCLPYSIHASRAAQTPTSQLRRASNPTFEPTHDWTGRSTRWGP